MSSCKYIIVALALIALNGQVCAEEGSVIKLPAPMMSGGKPLLEALRDRHSSREYSARALSRLVLSNLLWAAAGVNRTDSGKRTAPSARDWREIDIYLSLPEGVYRYHADEHALVRVSKQDVRAATGVQDFVGQVPVNLVYVADLNRMGEANPEQKKFYAAADTGFIAQNVYLFCASEGLATVVRGSVDREALAPLLGLTEHQQIILAQSVGYPVR